MEVVRGRDSAGSAQLQALFLDSLPTVYGFLLARTVRGEQAEDLASETYEAAARMFGADRGDEVTLAWLLAVARRRLIDHWRRSESHRRRLQRLHSELVVRSRGDDGVEGWGDERVLGALGSLSERQRAVLVLRYMDELSVSEVAGELGVGYETAESLLSRARASFRAAYYSQEEDDDVG